MFYYLCIIFDIYNKHAWVAPLKEKKCITITNDFQNVLDESGRKPHKTWVDKGSKFYNRLMKSLLQDNGIEVYSKVSNKRGLLISKGGRNLCKI